MEIRALHLRVTQDELNEWIRRLLSSNEKVHGLAVAITRQGMLLKGTYQIFGGVPFEATLEIGVDGGLVGVRLNKMQAGGLFPVPQALVTSMVMGKLTEHQNDWMRVEGETLVFDIERMLQERGISVITNLYRVSCEEGVIILEAQVPAAAKLSAA